MPLPIIPILMGLAQVVPGIVGLLAGDKAGEKAEAVADVVKTVTGQDDLKTGVGMIKADPEAALKFQQAFYEYQIEMEREETKRYQEYHQTIRTEVSSTDSYNRRWRATFGYCVSFSWALMFATVFVGFLVAGISSEVDMADVTANLASLIRSTLELWGIALVILGVNIKKRSDDKTVAVGTPRPGILGTIVNGLRK